MRRLSVTLFFKAFLTAFVFGLSLLVYLDIQVSKAFAAKRWAIPAKVYARPLEIYQGLSLNSQALVDELKRLNYRQVESITQAGTFKVTADQVQVFSRGFQFADGLEASRNVTIGFDDQGGANAINLARVSALNSQARSESITLFRLEPLLIGSIHSVQGEARELVRLSDAPPLLYKTLMAVEDKSFLEHKGISMRGMVRAFLVNVGAGEVVQGGSTITQQLVKNLFLTHERTLMRKVTEAFMAVLLEFHYSKEEILEVYLNEVYLGQAGGRGIHGFAMASLYYFGVPLNEISEDQIALLVAMVRGASWYNPRKHESRALNRRNQVLSTMYQEKLIDQTQLTQAKARSLGVTQAKPSQSRYPAFMDLVKRQLKADYREEDLKADGLKIFTTLDPGVQSAATKSLDQRMPSMQAKYGGKDGSQLEAAMVVTQPQTGEVLALIGGRRHEYAGFNRALDARRPIGSVIKPLVYLAALEQGYSWASPLQDVPVRVDTPQGVWAPKNFDGESRGSVLMETALANSYNQATVRLGLSVGIDKVVELLEVGAGVKAPEVPALLLGAVEMTPFEVSGLYQSFAAQGFNTPLRAIRNVLNVHAEPLSRYPFKVTQVFNAQQIYLLNHGLQQVVEQGTARKIHLKLPATLGLAGKTGTSDRQRDAWFVGYSQNLLATVWVGRDDNAPTALTGSNSALEVWMDLFARLPIAPLSQVQPSGIKWVWVDSDQPGFIAPDCKGARLIPVAKNFTAPKLMCAKPIKPRSRWGPKD